MQANLFQSKNFNRAKNGDYGSEFEDDYSSYRPGTPEERVANVAVGTSAIYKREALKAAKEAAISKKVANRATENAHAF